MRQVIRLPFYAIWHLVWALLIAYSAAFVMLHGYSTRFEYLSFWDAVSRTINYVIPQWHFVIIPAAFIVLIISIAGQILMTGISRDEENLAMGCSLVFAILGAGLFVLLFQFLALVIFIPLIIEVLIISLIDSLLSRHSSKKIERPSYRKYPALHY